MKKLFYTLLILCGMNTWLSAQYVDYALRFSQQQYGSTARSKAMGNAFGALGADFSSLSINPAGIAVYQRSDVSATLNLVNLNQTETSYQGTNTSDQNNNFNFRNLGYVTYIPMVNSKVSGLVSLNVGFGFNRLNNFNQTTNTQSKNSPHSRMDAFAQNTNGFYFDDLVSYDNYDPYENGIPWESKMAWENYLIDVTNSTTGGDKYETFLMPNEIVKQSEYISREGYINEYVTTLGANFNHNLYLGATFGIHDLYYDEAKLFTEEGLPGSNYASFGQFDYSSYATTTGVGYNLKLGAIYRPIPALRLGVAIHTPTWYFLKETYNSIMTSHLTNVSSDANGDHKEETPVGHYSYNLSSPFRAIGSAALQFGKKGVVSFDYEYVNYSSMRLNKGVDDYNFKNENSDIQETYKGVNNFRLGAEYRLTDSFSLRGGMELFGNPYNKNSYNVPQPNIDYNFKTYNGGLGYRIGNFAFDVAYSMGDKTDFSYIYQVDNINVEPVKYHALTHELIFTIGMKL